MGTNGGGSRFLYFRLSAGNYTANIDYIGELLQTPSVDFSYTIQIPPKEDNRTQGNWKEKYGTKGFVLYNYDSIGQNYQELPDFVEDFRINRSGDPH